ncbi:MAG: DNA polymerase III subunit delta' [Candidatus Brocadiia bacterium]
MLGQERAKLLLAAAFAPERLGHAYLFTGPDGVGKTLLAQEAAQALLCRGDGARPCGACQDCRLFAHDSHPDFLLLEPEGDSRVIKIDKIRDLIHTLSLMPVQGDRRVAIIREADALQEPAANALLKTLEEPPASALLILTSSRPRALLPTLRSRCQEIRFEPLSAEHLRAILDDRPGLDEEDVAAAVRLAGGSADRALQLIESGCLEIRRKTLARILALPAEDVFDLADDVLDWARAAAKQLEPQRERLRAFLYMLESTYRDIMVRAVCDGKEGPQQPALSEVEGPDAAQRLPPRRLLGIHEAVCDARRQIDANATIDFVLQDLFERIARLQQAT